jgi:hypothetical protein
VGRVTTICKSCGVLKSGMYVGGCTVGRVRANVTISGVQKKAYISVNVTWAELEQFIQNMVCHKMAF